MMKKIRTREYVLTTGMVLLPVVCIFASLFLGNYSLGIQEVFSILFQPGENDFAELTVVWQLRLPRAVIAAFTGAALSVAGAVFQGIFRNPIVNSSLLGVSNGAGLGACIAIVLLGGGVMIYPLAFGFAILAVVLAYLIAQVCGNAQNITLILGGVIVSNLFSALISILKYMADPYSQLPSITFWFMGSFATVGYQHFIALIPMTIGFIGIFALRWQINVLSMGDKEALALGVDVSLCKGILIACATLVTASAVCVSGSIGWVGLIIPHIARMMYSNDNVKLIPLSASLGASFMVVIDLIARNISTYEVPVGILTSIIGAPFFVYILKTTKGGRW